MSCSCHDSRENDSEIEVDAFKPCLFCAMKHAVTAQCLLTEYAYIDSNLCAAEGQMRACINHLMKTHQDICHVLRNAAILLQQRRLDDVERLLTKAICRIQDQIYESHPDIKERAEEHKARQMARLQDK